ncbi:MAG: hypothetical protein GY765_23540 [bacterium]|nr:hypothetical protein [bacterium]
MRKRQHPTKIILVIMFTLMQGLTLWASNRLEEQASSFHLDGMEYNLYVQETQSGSDIILDTGESVNLSFQYPGANLFPSLVHLSNRRFIIGWIHYIRDNVQMCLYDSLDGSTRFIGLKNFKSAWPKQVVFYRGSPHGLVFRGNNSDNTDIFYYKFATARMENITRTPLCEREVEVFDNGRFIGIHTDTLSHNSVYRVKKRNLRVKLTESEEIEKVVPVHIPVISSDTMNTVVGFGDSITWGVVRMDIDNPNDYEHPELAYLAQLRDILSAEDYGTINIVNGGVSRDTSGKGVARMHEVFTEADAYYCLVMFGTNDVGFNFDVNTSIENLQLILRTARDDYHMYPVISTIPPQKNEQKGLPGEQFYVNETETLNAAIKVMATANAVANVDTYSAFFDGPHYWEDLLELVKGNHPSPLGHTVIANLFKEKILELPPEMPGDFSELVTAPKRRTVQWSENEEFDFGQYDLQWGYSPDNLNRSGTTTESHFDFAVFPLHEPFYTRIYYRVRAVDKDGNTLGYTSSRMLEF